MSEYRFFKIPAATGTEQESELNRFLRGHRVLQVHRDFVAAGGESFWAFSVEFLASGPSSGDVAPSSLRGRVDYKEILNEADFEVFSRLRQIRKDLAEKESVPPYTIFTNEQLAEMVRKRAITVEMLQEIAGVGEVRSRKYAGQFLPAVQEYSRKEKKTDEASGKSDA